MTLVTGIGASLLAFLALAVWACIGSLARRGPSGQHPALSISAWIVLGAAATSFAFAVLTWAGIVTPALWIAASVGGAAIAARLAVVTERVRAIIATLRTAGRNASAGRGLIASAAVLLWVMAIAPPRDADVMHYHLAHIRQILRDGAWHPVADALYAIPFGWSLNFLPFEALGIPQAAGLVSFGLWWVVLALLLSATATNVPSALRLPLCLLFLAHPYVLKIFSSALPDAYAILLVTVILVILRELETADSRMIALLGFVSWIGAQSRYQLVAVGIAVSLLVVLHTVRSRRWTVLALFSAGGIGAVVLALPFYLSNLATYGNPVWPLLTQGGASASYASEVAASMVSTLALPFEWGTYTWTVPYLLTSPAVFPIPIVIVSLTVGALVLTRGGDRRIAAFAALFIVQWAVMTPRLYPTHLLPLVPAGPILLASLWRREWNNRWIRRAVVTATLGVAASLAVATAVSWDYLRYAISGDSDTFHRFTWYYPVYQWANRNTPADSRFLVIVRSGQTYYLDRPYITADPFLSAEVDWRNVGSSAELGDKLRAGGYEYVIYDDMDWSAFPGGRAMQSAIDSAVSSGLLVPVHTSREILYTRRVQRRAIMSDVHIFRLSDDSD